MTFQVRIVIDIFNKYRLTLPPQLNWHEDNSAGKRSVFITDKSGSFQITFEEGMRMLDMHPEIFGEEPTICAQYCDKSGYIHQRRAVKAGVSCAFFHFELEDENGGIMHLPGQITSENNYVWSENVEPVLIEIMNGITVCRTKGGGTS